MTLSRRPTRGLRLLAVTALLAAGVGSGGAAHATGRTLTFTFTDELNGQRVAGACVDLWASDDNGDTFVETRCAGAKQSRLVIRDAPDVGLFAVTAPHAAYLRYPAVRPHYLAVIDPSGTTSVALTPAAVFTGRLVRPDGSPVSGVEVELTDPEWTIQGWTTTAADGTWRAVAPADKERAEYRVLVMGPDGPIDAGRGFRARLRERIDTGTTVVDLPVAEAAIR